jgi:hypothetical protein
MSASAAFDRLATGERPRDAFAKSQLWANIRDFLSQSLGSPRMSARERASELRLGGYSPGAKTCVYDVKSPDCGAFLIISPKSFPRSRR